MCGSCLPNPLFSHCEINFIRLQLSSHQSHNSRRLLRSSVRFLKIAEWPKVVRTLPEIIAERGSAAAERIAWFLLLVFLFLSSSRWWQINLNAGVDAVWQVGVLCCRLGIREILHLGSEVRNCFMGHKQGKWDASLKYAQAPKYPCIKISNGV